MLFKKYKVYLNYKKIYFKLTFRYKMININLFAITILSCAIIFDASIHACKYIYKIVKLYPHNVYLGTIDSIKYDKNSNSCDVYFNEDECVRQNLYSIDGKEYIIPVHKIKKNNKLESFELVSYDKKTISKKCKNKFFEKCTSNAPSIKSIEIERLNRTLEERFIKECKIKEEVEYTDNIFVFYYKLPVLEMMASNLIGKLLFIYSPNEWNYYNAKTVYIKNNSECTNGVNAKIYYKCAAACRFFSIRAFIKPEELVGIDETDWAELKKHTLEMRKDII